VSIAYEVGFKAFMSVSAILGMIVLIGVVMFGIVRFSVWALGRWQELSVVMLCLAFLRHGKDYRDRLFWEAVSDRASRSRFSAKTIADFAMKKAPGSPDDGYDI
jgi:hypothetical protein